MACATAFVALIFVVAPHVVMESWAADQRIAPVLIMCALMAVAPVNPSRALTATAVVLVGLVVGNSMFGYAAMSDRLTSFLSLGRSIPIHSRVASFYMQSCDPYAESSEPRQKGASLFIGRNHIFTSQWNYGGSNLLQVTDPQAGEFKDLRRTNVWPAHCSDTAHPSIERTLAVLPPKAFDYVIVDGSALASVEPIASRGGANLYSLPLISRPAR